MGIEGDDAWLYHGFSAADHVNNDNKPWTAAGLAAALQGVAMTDDGLQVFGSSLIPLHRPSADVLDALEKVARGIPVSQQTVLQTHH